MMSFGNKLLLIIIILAAFLRFYKLGSNPPALYWDEVSLGFNAYSILQTGRDEHNERLPYNRFIAFGDFKPPGYIYFAVPSVALFGLNEFATRFPSALAGVVMVVMTYLLIKELFGKETVALLGAFLLSISPWALHMSRAAFEANLAAGFNLLAIFFFFKALKRGRWLLLTALFFALTFYTFNSNRLLMLLLLLGMLVFYFKDLWQIKKWLILGGLLGLVLLLPLLPYLKTREARLRFDEVNIFSNLEVIKLSNKRISTDGHTLVARVIHHRFLGHFFNFLKGFFSFFDPAFLFFSGDANPRLSSQAVGELYLVELPFLLAGSYYLFAKKQKHAKFLIFWGLVALVPASTAREVPHALRALSVLPVPQIITSFSLINFFNSLRTKKRRLAFVTCYSLLVTGYFLYYQYFYYFKYPYLYSGEWQYGYKELVQEVTARERDYDKVAITDYIGRPYIYFLFYERYEPAKFWQTVARGRDWFGFQTVFAFDKYRFGNVNLESYLAEPGNILLAVRPEKEIPRELHQLKIIKKLNGEPQFILVEKR